MFKPSMIFVVFLAVCSAHRNGGGGRRGGDRGGGLFNSAAAQQELVCGAEQEEISCGSPRFAEGVTGTIACRTVTKWNWWSSVNVTNTICVVPEEATVNDICGCCGEACPTVECTCECDNGAGFLMTPDHPFRDDEDGSSNLLCVAKEAAVVAVANGRAACYEGCSCGN
mmetsp:Transcript_879/g.1725  ORF Transcript_879/g.1725 Transcript_879/m.1725 type:complete len:169 (-) Transcript_879:86-592(-)|eukprot:scaffold6577_cov175-Amphora_coffeaeformis.AAC.1